MNILKNIPIMYWIVAGTFVLVLAMVGFVAYEGNTRSVSLSSQNDVLSAQLQDISLQLNMLEEKLAAATSTLEGNIEKAQSDLTGALEQEKQNVTAFKQEFGSFQSTVGNIAGSVTTLEKLSKIDPELLQKYSKVFFLNEHYEPARLVEIPTKWKYNGYKSLTIHEKVWPHLEEMLIAAQADNKELFVSSAFRSFSEQKGLKDQYSVLYGEGTANQFSADQGYSEHQLGATVDFMTTGINGTFSDFEITDEYSWLLRNAHIYGFVLSYPEDNQYYIFEPWHWRFVGVRLATDLYTTHRNFYDVDQRDIDEYLVSFFD